MSQMQLHLQYEPRQQFLPLHHRNQRFGAVLCHRRAGKTVAGVNDLVIRASYSKKKRPKYAYIGPFRQQAKDVAWEYLKDASEGIRKGVPRESDLRVTLLNNATITIYGADNVNAFRGLYFDGVILDEYADMRPSIWGEVILPTLMDRDGWVLFTGTIKGKNHFYQVCERAKREPGWFFMEMKGSTSGILSQEKLDLMRAEMTEAQYLQEIECDPTAAIPGTYYSDLISDAEREGRIGDHPYDGIEAVHVAADIGFSDSTAFWFWQIREDGPVLIDYYESDGKSLEHYFAMLRQKQYHYADIWLPHDAVARTLQTGRSTVEQFLEEGLPVKIVPRLAIQHGIDASRKILRHVRFDQAACHNGIESLRAYRRSWNEKTQQYANHPMHDWASNGADAFRYFALVTSDHSVVTQEAKPDPFKSPEFTLNDLWDARETSSVGQILRI